MKKVFVIASLMTVSLLALAQKFSPADENSTVKFKIKNLGFNVGGSFTGLEGVIVFDPADLPGSSFDVSIDAATVNTGIDLRDHHLKGESYFDVEKYPKISFRSTKVSASNKSNVYFVHGQLTIKNTAQEISFPFTAEPENDGYRFKGEFNIRRMDFGVGGHSTVSNELTVALDVFGKK